MKRTNTLGLTFDHLDAKVLPAVVGVTVYGSTLFVATDNISTYLALTRVGSNIQLQTGGTVQNFSGAIVKSVVVVGGAGNDDFRANNLNIPVRLYGQGGADQLFGGSANDILSGGDGADRIHGFSGNDYLCGGTGNDIVHGWDGNDTVKGEAGRDTLYGGAGNDYIHAGLASEGNLAFGHAGADLFVGLLPSQIADFMATHGDRRA